MNAAVLAIIQAAIVLVAGATAVLRGGEWIGRVERTAVFATVLTGVPEGIAIALALKASDAIPS